MPTTNVKFNLPDPTGTARFISPITVISMAGESDVKFTGNLSLQFGYLVKSYAEENYTDKTLMKAGAMTRPALEDAISADPDATIGIYMPTAYESRESEDLALYTQIAIVKASVLLPVAIALESGFAFFTAQDEVYKTLPKNDLNVVQPVYFTPDPKAGKVAKPGKANQPIRLTFAK